MDSSLFIYSHQELKFLVTQFSSKREIVIDVHERFLLYEAYKRYIEKSEFYTMKWAEQSLRLSFPKIYSMVDKLVNLGYLKRARSTKDKRIVYLEPTEKLILGIVRVQNYLLLVFLNQTFLGYYFKLLRYFQFYMGSTGNRTQDLLHPKQESYL